LAAVTTAAGRFVEIVDQNGMVAASTNAARQFMPFDAAKVNGQVPMLASTPLTHAPWQVGAGQPRSRGLAGGRRLRTGLWGVGPLLALVAAAIALPLLNNFVRALRRLTDATETMSRGDLSQPVPVGQRGDELATLGRAFEQMRVELGRSRRSLEQRL